MIDMEKNIKKIEITAMLVGVMLIAVGFLIQPVQQATAIHPTIQANVVRQFVLTATLTVDNAAGADEEALWILGQPFETISQVARFSVDTNNNCNLAASNIRTDLIPETGFFETDPAINTALNAVRDLEIDSIPGNTRLAITLLEEATCEAADAQVVSVLVRTSGALTAAPAATLTAAGGAAGLAND